MSLAILSSPGRNAEIPALEFKVAVLVVLLVVTLLFGLVPLCLVHGAGPCSISPESRRRLLALINCFAGGVFLATCLLDLLPDYLQGISAAFSSAGITLQFPLPEFIVAMGFFLVLVLEQVIVAFRDQSWALTEERQSLLENSSVQAVDSGEGLPHQRRHTKEQSDSASSALRAFVLVFSLSLHSLFEGLAVGLLGQVEEVLEVCLALVIHKSVISLSLAFTLVHGRLRRPLVIACLLLFAAMAPLGVGLGVALSESKTSPQGRLACYTLEGMATGTFIYITFMEILPHELGHGRGRVAKVAVTLLGFAVVTAVLFIKM
ncbi:zinc transporter ZIP1-like [Dunckerocampus dactyliophorus]|uniref:zinc transporter ZIP1-like n=1 Tax=Dunckerocampus dactyliophorus TaxID=161453 RepID=UPI00240679F1|nr:zinc transporter ZIP1-like [Dunckerocampus dactyliophorus]XP_054636944.1 zinc transporter ZIP1-like [Dunckerocampus dactyliophorus]XP_054636946.1 zinc transporter ZIP1-like [Dunckerocampus dactyliophorus]